MGGRMLMDSMAGSSWCTHYDVGVLGAVLPSLANDPD
jgi:hypothetical protein